MRFSKQHALDILLQAGGRLCPFYPCILTLVAQGAKPPARGTFKYKITQSATHNQHAKHDVNIYVAFIITLICIWGVRNCDRSGLHTM